MSTIPMISAADQTSAAAVPPKLLHAAQQFEALLLNDLLGPVEKAFSSIPGKQDETGSDNYQYLATQALAAHIAAGGGIGIAAKIVHNLMQRMEIKAQSAETAGAKVPHPIGR